MRRRTVAWLLAFPLAVAGSQVAHGLAYRLVTPDGGDRAHELTATGHAYLAYLPLVLAACTVLLVMGLAAELLRLAAHGFPRAGRPSAWRFAILAPSIFVLQEHFERLAQNGGFPIDAALEPTFLVGLLLQAPFALAAYMLARLLLRVVRALAGLLSTSPRDARLGWSPRWHLTVVSLPRIPALALGYSSRGPPALRA